MSDTDGKIRVFDGGTSGSRDGIELKSIGLDEKPVPKDVEAPLNACDEDGNNRDDTSKPDPKPTRTPMQLLMWTVAISFGLLTLVLLVNGSLMAYGLYSLYGSASGGLAFEKLSVTGIEDLDARISFAASFPTTGLGRLPSFEIKKPSRLHLELPGFRSAHLPEKQPRAVTVELPEIRYGRTGEGAGRLKADDIQVKINEELPLSDLALWYLSQSQKKNGHAMLTGSVTVSTWSFLVPITYEYKVHMKIPLKAPAQKEKEDEATPPLLSLTGLQMFEEKKKDRLRCMLSLGLGESLLPGYAELKLPELAFRFRHYIDEKHPQDFIQIKMMPQEFVIDGSRNSELFVEIDGAGQADALQRLLSAYRDGDLDFDVQLVGVPDESKEKKKQNKLQAWMATLSVRTGMATLLSKKPKRIVDESERTAQYPMGAAAKLKRYGLVVLSETKRLTTRLRQLSHAWAQTEEDPSSGAGPVDLEELYTDPIDHGTGFPMSFGFVGLEGDASVPRFIFRFAISTGFLHRLTGMNSNAIKGKLPPIKLSQVLERKMAPGVDLTSLEITHVPSSSRKHPDELRFELALDIFNIREIVMVGTKLMQSMQPGTAVDMSDLRAITVGATEDTMLGRLLAPFRLEFDLKEQSLGLAHGPGYRPDPNDDLKPEKKSKPRFAGYLLQTARDELHRVAHEAAVKVTSGPEAIAVTGTVKLDREPALHRNPFIHIYWEALHLSLFPSKELCDESPDGRRPEMLHFDLRKGSFRSKMAQFDHPALMIYRGGLEFTLGLTGPNIIDPSEHPHRDLELVRVWKGMWAAWSADVEGPLDCSMVVSVRDRHLEVPLLVPRRRDLASPPSDDSMREWTVWTEQLIQSNLSLAGIQDGVLNFLVHLPELGSCSRSKSPPKLRIVGRVELPAFGMNVCMEKEALRSRGIAEVSGGGTVCLFKLGLSKPIVTTLTYQDGRMCNLMTRFVEDRAAILRHRSSLLAEHRRHRSERTERDLEDSQDVLALRNVLPMYMSVLDLNGALSVAPDFWNHRVNTYKISSGYAEKTSYHDRRLPLIERFANGFISGFEEYLPRLGHEGFRRARSVVEEIGAHLAVVTEISVTSPNAQHLTVKIKAALPRECFEPVEHGRRRPIRDEANSSLAELMRLRWGSTEVILKTEGDSYVKISIDQGQVYLSNSAAQLTDSFREASEKFKLRIDLHAGRADMSSRNLQMMKNYFVAAFNAARDIPYPPELILGARQIPEMQFNAELRSQAYQHHSMPEAEGEEADYSINRSFKGDFVVHLMQQIYRMLQGRRPSPAEHNTVRGWDYKMVVEPFPIEDRHDIRLPFLFDHNCKTTAELMVPERDRRLIKFKLHVHRLVFYIVRMFADSLAVALKNIGLAQHPGLLKFVLNCPGMRLFGQMNGISAVEAIVDAFDFERIVSLLYDARGSEPLSEVDEYALGKILTVSGQVNWGPNIRDLADVISPARIVMTKGPQPALRPIPDGPPRIQLQNSSMTMAFGNELVPLADRNLFSSMFCAWYGEHAISPMLRALSTGESRIQVSMVDVDLSKLVLEAQNIFIPWPLASVQVQVDEPVQLDFIFRGRNFLSIKVGPVTLTAPETLIERASIILSRTGLDGEPLPVDRFSRDFADFIAGLVLSRSIDFEIRVRLENRNLTVRIPIHMPTVSATLAFFDSNESDVVISELLSFLGGSTTTSIGGWIARNVLSPLAGYGSSAWTFLRETLGTEVASPEYGEEETRRLYPRMYVPDYDDEYWNVEAAGDENDGQEPERPVHWLYNHMPSMSSITTAPSRLFTAVRNAPGQALQTANNMKDSAISGVSNVASRIKTGTVNAISNVATGARDRVYTAYEGAKRRATDAIWNANPANLSLLPDDEEDTPVGSPVASPPSSRAGSSDEFFSDASSEQEAYIPPDVFEQAVSDELVDPELASVGVEEPFIPPPTHQAQPINAAPDRPQSAVIDQDETVTTDEVLRQAREGWGRTGIEPGVEQTQGDLQRATVYTPSSSDSLSGSAEIPEGAVSKGVSAILHSDAEPRASPIALDLGTNVRGNIAAFENPVAEPRSSPRELDVPIRTHVVDRVAAFESPSSSPPPSPREPVQTGRQPDAGTLDIGDQPVPVTTTPEASVRVSDRVSALEKGAGHIEDIIDQPVLRPTTPHNVAMQPNGGQPSPLAQSHQPASGQPQVLQGTTNESAQMNSATPQATGQKKGRRVKKTLTHTRSGRPRVSPQNPQSGQQQNVEQLVDAYAQTPTPESPPNMDALLEPSPRQAPPSSSSSSDQTAQQSPGLFSGVSSFLSSARERTGSTLTALREGASRRVQSVRDTTASAVNTVGGALSGIREGASRRVQSVRDTASSAVNTVGGVLQQARNIPTNAGAVLGGIYDQGRNTLSNARERTGSMLESTRQTIVAIPGQLAGAYNSVTGAGSNLISGAQQRAAAARDTIAQTADRFFMNPSGFGRAFDPEYAAENAAYRAAREAPVETSAMNFIMPQEAPSTAAGTFYHILSSGAQVFEGGVGMIQTGIETGGNVLRSGYEGGATILQGGATRIQDGVTSLNNQVNAGIEAVQNYGAQTLISAINYATAERRTVPDAVTVSASDTELEDIFANTGLPLSPAHHVSSSVSRPNAGVPVNSTPQPSPGQGGTPFGSSASSSGSSDQDGTPPPSTPPVSNGWGLLNGMRAVGSAIGNMIGIGGPSNTSPQGNVASGGTPSGSGASNSGSSDQAGTPPPSPGWSVSGAMRSLSNMVGISGSSNTASTGGAVSGGAGGGSPSASSGSSGSGDAGSPVDSGATGAGTPASTGSPVPTGSPASTGPVPTGNTPPVIPPAQETYAQWFRRRATDFGNAFYDTVVGGPNDPSSGGSGSADSGSGSTSTPASEGLLDTFTRHATNMYQRAFGESTNVRRPRGPARRPPTRRPGPASPAASEGLLGRATRLVTQAFEYAAPVVEAVNEQLDNIYEWATAPSEPGPGVPEGISGADPAAAAAQGPDDRSPEARRARRLALMATFLQEQLRLYRSYDTIRSGTNEWASSFADADLTSTNLQDMTWVGLADHTDPGFFRSFPSRTEHLSTTVYRMVRKLRLPNIYALSFRNDSDFHLAVVGQILNLYFTDGDGFVSMGSDRLLNGVQEKPEINARLHVLPEACQWGANQRTPGLAPLMRCMHHNAGRPAVSCPPGSHHKGRDRFLAPLEITMNDLILLADENYNHDGRCMVTKDSLVVLGIFHPTDASKYILLDIILNMDEIENLMANDPYGDPCGRVFRAIPDGKVVEFGGQRGTSFFRGLMPRDYTIIKHRADAGAAASVIDTNSGLVHVSFHTNSNFVLVRIFIGPAQVDWEVRDTSYELVERHQHEYHGGPLALSWDPAENSLELAEQTRSRSTTIYRFTCPYINADSFGIIHETPKAALTVVEPAVRRSHHVSFAGSLFGIHWEHEPLNLNNTSVINLDMRVANLPQPTTAEHQRTHVRFGFCFKTFANTSDLSPFYMKGNSVCVYFYPSTRQIHIVDHGSGQILHKKPQAGLNIEFFQKARNIKLIYNPMAPQQLSIAVDTAEVGHRYSSRYTLDLAGILNPAVGEKVHFGFFTELFDTTGVPAMYLIYDLKMAYSLPDLWLTDSYFIQTQSALPHQQASFALQLKDERGGDMFQSPLGLNIELWPIEDDFDDTSHPCSSAFVWTKRETGYSAPDRHTRYVPVLLPDPTVLDAPVPDPIDLSAVRIRNRFPVTDLQHSAKGLYIATARIPQPGRYRVMVQLKEGSPRMTGYVPERADAPHTDVWVPVRNMHVYVRNYYDVE